MQLLHVLLVMSLVLQLRCGLRLLRVFLGCGVLMLVVMVMVMLMLMPLQLLLCELLIC
jgi:hypothetical protein